MIYLIYLLVMTRPISYFDFDIGVFGFSTFEVFSLSSLGLTFLLAILLPTRPRRSLTAFEFWVLVHVIWSAIVFLWLYPAASPSAFAKWIFPPITFAIFARSFWSPPAFFRAMQLLLVAFSLPVFVSTYMTISGMGVGKETYWTGLVRYKGIYSGIHEMGHNMGLCIIAALICYGITRQTTRGDSPQFHMSSVFTLFLAALCTAALYNMYMSSVRTVYVGLLVFLAVVLFRYSKKLLLVGAFTLTVLLAWQAEKIAQQFFDFVEIYEGKRDILMAGSGRLYIWNHNLKIFDSLPIERKIIGVGMGNTTEKLLDRRSIDGNQAITRGVWNSHNDFLSSLLETGIVGLAILIVLYFYLWRRIGRLPDSYRFYFLGFFWAVMTMHLLSNSYLNRFTLWQTFFIIMAGTEILAPQTNDAATKSTLANVNARRFHATPSQNSGRRSGRLLSLPSLSSWQRARDPGPRPGRS